MYVCMSVCMHACMHACMYACMHACMYVCMHIMQLKHKRDHIFLKNTIHIFIYIYTRRTNLVWHVVISLDISRGACIHICIYIYIYHIVISQHFLSKIGTSSDNAYVRGGEIGNLTSKDGGDFFFLRMSSVSTPLKNMTSSVGTMIPNWMETYKSHVPNHQPYIYNIRMYMTLVCLKMDVYQTNINNISWGYNGL